MRIMVNMISFKRSGDAGDVFKKALRNATIDGDYRTIMIPGDINTELYFTEHVDDDKIEIIKRDYACNVDMHVVPIDSLYLAMKQRAILDAYMRVCACTVGEGK